MAASKTTNGTGHHITSTTQADQFTTGTLSRSDLSASPFAQFHTWYAAAADLPKREACTLSTASLPSGRVSARIVYLKELDDTGFVVYSNFGTSRKAADVASNPFAALTFFWEPLERQVRVEGPAQRLSSAESQTYFDVRVRGSRVGAWASQQSRVLKDREELHEQVREVERRFEGQDKIPVPEFWGGLRIVPEVVEFWQGRDSRLHDRFEYKRESVDSGEWRIERLSP